MRSLYPTATHLQSFLLLHTPLAQAQLTLYQNQALDNMSTNKHDMVVPEVAALTSAVGKIAAGRERQQKTRIWWCESYVTRRLQLGRRRLICFAANGIFFICEYPRTPSPTLAQGWS